MILPNAQPSHGPESPIVTAIIVNWNRSSLLRSCLESLREQRDVVMEAIVVDNGSSDDSVRMVEDLRREMNFQLRLIANKENLGYCAGNNQGISAARGEFVALLNNDAVAHPEWLSNLIAAARRHPSAGMIASKILVYEMPDRIDKAGHLIWPDGQNRGRGTGERDLGQFDKEEEVLWPDGCAALYRKAMLDAIGGFDEDLFAYGDDAELGLRARIAGWSCFYAPGAVVRHHRSSTLGILSSRRIRLIERNRILLAIRHFPIGLLAQMPFWSALRFGAGLVAGMRGRGEAGRFAGPGEKLRLAGALLRGMAEAIPLIPGMWRKRRDSSELRRLSGKQIVELLFRFKISLKALSEGAF